MQRVEQLRNEAAELLTAATMARRFDLTVADLRQFLVGLREQGVEPTGRIDTILAGLDPDATTEVIVEALQRRASSLLGEWLLPIENEVSE